MVGWLNTYQPHSVLLHIGTNDVLQNYAVSTAPNRLSALIDRITATLPSAEVFVAQLTPLANAGQEAAVRTFNAAIPAIVQSKVNAGRHVHLVDQHSALTAADLVDGIHPTAAGYDKMAAVWFSALRSVPGSIGSPQTAGGQQVVGAQSGRCLDVAGSSTAPGTRVQVWDCDSRTSQRWTSTPGRQLMVYGNACLDASGQGTTNGTPVIIWDCNGQPNQQWNINPDGTITGGQSGLCLDAQGRGTANGTAVILWSCNGGSNQQWSLRP